LILSTTNEKSVLENMDMSDCFNSELYISNIADLQSISHVLDDSQLFSPEEKREALERLRISGIDQRISIGIKKLMMVIEMSRQDVDKVDKFVNTLMGL